MPEVEKLGLPSPATSRQTAKTITIDRNPKLADLASGQFVRPRNAFRRWISWPACWPWG